MIQLVICVIFQTYTILILIITLILLRKKIHSSGVANIDKYDIDKYDVFKIGSY